MSLFFGLGTREESVRVDGGILINNGPDTLYYKASPGVSSTTKDGSLNLGGSISLDGSQYVVSAGHSQVVVIVDETAGGQGPSGPQGPPGAINGRTDLTIGNLGTAKTLTLSSTDDEGQVDVPVTLTANGTLTIGGLNTVTRCEIWLYVTQDATGGWTFTVKNGLDNSTIQVTTINTTANAGTLVIVKTYDGATLQVITPASASLPVATKTGDRLTLDTTGAAAWQSPVNPPSAIDLAPYGNRMFHRGCGDFAEDDSLRALRVANGIFKGAWEIADAGDWRLNASGSVVSMHDSTVDRTCTTTGTVSALTDTQWRALVLRARTPAQPTTEGPPFATDVLDYCKKLGLICSPELKITGNSSFNTQVLGLIQARGMEKQCIVGSTLLGDLAVFKAAGVPTMYIVDTTPDTQANIIAAAPDFFSYNANRPTSTVTDAMLQALHAAGIRVGFWLGDTVQDVATAVARLDGLGVPCQHYVSNAPQWASRVNIPPTRTRDPFSTGLFWPGMVQGAPYDSFGLFTQFSRGTFTGSPYRFSLPDPDNASWVLQGWMTPCTSATGSITLNITYDAIGTDTSKWAAVAFNCPTDRLLWNETTAGNRGNGYAVILRVTGSLELYRLAGDGLVSANPTSGAAIQATAAITSGQTVTLKIEPNLASNQIRVTRTDAGGFTALTATDSTYRAVGTDPRSPYVWFGKRASTGTGTKVSFSNVTVVP